MKLSYRGQSYEYDPNQLNNQLISYPQQSHELKYRGVAYNTNSRGKVEQICLLSAAHKLIYRGIAYIINSTAQQQDNSVAVIVNH